MLCFDALRHANVTRQKEWDPHSKIMREFRGLEMGGEGGEVMEVVLAHLLTALTTIKLGAELGQVLNMEKKLSRERMGIRGSRVTQEQLEEELADLILTADLLAADAGIDLGEAVRKKFNAVSLKMGLDTRIPNGDLEETEWPRKQPQPKAKQSLLARGMKSLFNRHE